MCRNPRSSIRKLNLVGCMAIVTAVGGFGGWGSTTEIAGAVIAPGVVVVESNVKKVQHLSGGIVGEILVKEGTEVEADQVLIRLDDTLARATLGVVQSQLDLYVARETRLLAERDGAAAVALMQASFTRTEAGESALSGERRLFQSRREGLQSQREQLHERIAQVGEEIRGLTAQQQSKGREIDYVCPASAPVRQIGRVEEGRISGPS